MGLQSSLTTALTGMNAAETQIDVLGNNLANAQTVGFKASKVVFANQFLHTLSVGSAPTIENGGTNPRQVGLGVQVAAINPNLKPGTIELSSSPSDLAIRGEGYFQVEGSQGERLYTRNGIFKLNGANELVNSTGHRVLGYGVDEQFNIVSTDLVPLSIPLGTEAIAKATTEVTLHGTLTAKGDIADTSKIIQSAVLSDQTVPRPDASGIVLQGNPAVGAPGLTGNYTYMVTYYRAGEPESRPSEVLGPQSVVNGQIHLSNLPVPPAPPAGGGHPAYDEVRIYRNLANDPNSFYLVDTVAVGDDYTDIRSDADISNLATPGNQRVNLDGPSIDSNTRLVDVVSRRGFEYSNPFVLGELSFQARKGDRLLEEQSFTVTPTTTVQDLLGFMKDSMGIQSDTTSTAHPIVPSINNIPGESGTLTPNAYIANGAIRFVSNTGVDNGVTIDLTSLKIRDTSGNLVALDLGFGAVQQARGESVVTEFVAYDSLGLPIRTRVTATLEERNDQRTVYRWHADSPDNSDGTSSNIAVGTGLIYFDGFGNFVNATNSTVAVQRSGYPSVNPMQFELNFAELTGLGEARASFAAARQDGSAPGVLNNYVVGEDGIIRGVFSNGITRELGQIRLARFSNPSGLEQRGQNLLAQGINAGLPIQGAPSENGIGTVAAGAVELSNTDVGGDLVTLVLASTQYRSNARVITATQQLFDELLNIRR